MRHALFFNKKTAPYVFLCPFLVFFALFRIWPILWSLYVSMTDWTGFNTPQFLGFRNYINLLSDRNFITSVKNTLYFVVVYNAIMIFVAIVLAVLLNSSYVRFKKVYRSIFFIPIAMSLPVVATLFSLILAGNTGLLSAILKPFGVTYSLSWFDDVNYAMWAVILMRLWRGIGYYSAYFLAGLTGISNDIYESAKVDGASGVRMFFNISLPLLRPMILFVAIMSTILSFQLFDEPWVLTQGGPANATLTLQIYLYQSGFLSGKMGYASAISYLMTLLMMVASIFYVKRFGEKEVGRA